MSIRTLFIEDNRLAQMLYSKMVKESKESIHPFFVDSILEAQHILQNEEFDVVVCDYILTDGTSFQLIDSIRELNIPFLFVTGKGDEDIAVRAMKEGAFDYLMKDGDLHYLTQLPKVIKKASMTFKGDKKRINKQKEKESLTKKIFIISYYLTDAGPDYSTNIPKNVFSHEEIIRIGSFYYLAIAQGNERNIGIYELPVRGKPNYQAIIYAFEVQDKSLKDPRFNNMNYILLTILLPLQKRRSMTSLVKLEEELMIFINKYDQLSQITDFKKQNILTESIISSILENS
jgi:DNA-binding response OmpR family regulator